MNQQETLAIIVHGLLCGGYLSPDHPDWKGGVDGLIADARHILDRMSEPKKPKKPDGQKDKTPPK